MYRYIGNKTKLLPYIIEKVKELIGDTGTVADVMAGTGSVALELRKNGYSVFASDMMTYSYQHLVVNLLINEPPSFAGLPEASSGDGTAYENVAQYLNTIRPVNSFFYNEFSPEGSPASGLEARKYFTSDNAAKIDAIREQINTWINAKQITEIEAALLKHTLIMAVNKVANISGTYGHFLSKFVKSAMEPLVFAPVALDSSPNIEHVVRQGFAEDLAGQIAADLCYIDPPYMKRQYAANYHILETIARGDYPDAIGKSGLRDWWDQHSKLCTKTSGLESLERVIGEMHCNTFLVSYSEDGLFSLEQLQTCFEKFGEVDVQSIDYNRFRSNGSPLPKKLKEYLITIKKQEVEHGTRR